MSYKRLNPIERDRLNAIKEASKKENEAFKKVILDLESKIAKIDIELAEIRTALKTASVYSHDQMRVYRIRRRKLNKERQQLIIKLDLMQK